VKHPATPRAVEQAAGRLLLLFILLGFTLSVKGAPIQFGIPTNFPDSIGAPSFDHALDDAKLAGMSLVQIRADWPRIQPNADTWNFAWLDALITKAQARDLAVVLVFGPAPRWTASYLKDPAPEEIERARPDITPYERYVTAVTKRYAGRVRYYQLWERPIVANLLATAAESRKLYRAAARAVHRVDPTLRVIAAEPGDVQLGWINDYLREANGLERPDILLLSAVTERSTPEALARRMEMLRERVLTEPAPVLWASVTAATEQEWCWSAMVTLLMQNVTTLLPQPTAAYRDICAQPALLGELQSLAMLQGQRYLGWQRVGTALIGAFGKDEPQYAVILPDEPPVAGAALRLVPSAAPVDGGIAVPAKSVEVSKLSGTTERIDVDEEMDYRLSSRPIIMTGVLLQPAAGPPPRKSTPITCGSVGIDPSGADRDAVRPLRDLPGGKYGQEKYQGKIEIIRTLRDKEPWIHLDVPDDFIFYNSERQAVEVTISVRGSREPEKAGFLLYYDAVGGMAYSNWQWIDVGPFNKYSYTFRLDNALFAGSEGYDLRLDMGGSEEDIRLVDVAVRKIAVETAEN